MAISTRLVDYSDASQPYEGLVAWNDEASTTAPGILVAHTIRGRGELEERKARHLAELGFVAFCADVYGKSHIGSDLDNCREQMNALRADRAELQDRLTLSLKIMREQAEIDASKTAAIGFCFGGLCVLDIARINSDVAGVVSFHGLFDPPDNTVGDAIEPAVLVLHGWDDPMATPTAVRALAEELSARNANWQLHAYGNTVHAFTNPAANDRELGTVYDENADRRSWQAMRNFLDELFQD